MLMLRELAERRELKPTMELKENTTIVVLGASGDLAKKKTYPALFGLYRNQFLPKDVRIVGYARTKMDHEEHVKRIRSNMKTPTKESETQLDEFVELCTYISGQYDKDESFNVLNKHLEELEKDRSETHRLFYMALPPSVFTIVSQHLKRCCYPKNGIARVVVEKPFGKDLASSRELQKSLEPDWNEQELFRIDHYLGKEMVKNILILRFGNSFLGATWNRHHIDNVQITFKEPFGTEGRGGYFDEFGIVRDVMQNHLLQVLTLLAMERPISFDAEDIRDEKVRVLRAIPAIEPKNVIIGQYGKSLDGSKQSYKEDDTVPKDSRCPTFCALVAYIKNERWDGVPFIMKAGKALNEQKTEIRIQFKDVTSGIFKDIPRNELVMRIQPNESVYIKMNSKLPGLSMQTVVTELDLTYRRRFSDLKIPEAYESLVLDCLKGDQSNFVRDDELDASWRIFTPLLHYLDDNKEIIPMEYPYGSRGPAVLDDFTASYGYKFSDAAGYQWPTTTAAAASNKFDGHVQDVGASWVKTPDLDRHAPGAWVRCLGEALCGAGGATDLCDITKLVRKRHDQQRTLPSADQPILAWDLCVLSRRFRCLLGAADLSVAQRRARLQDVQSPFDSPWCTTLDTRHRILDTARFARLPLGDAEWMPGVINMENGGHDGVAKNYDRDAKLNGLNGNGKQADGQLNGQGAGKTDAHHAGNIVNGGQVGGTGLKSPIQQTQPPEQQSIEKASRMNDLPDEIIHITQGFVPLGLLLQRLSQTTHNQLQDKVAELAKMPLPQTALNGNTHVGSAPDDTSTENKAKKASLLSFAQTQHAKWVKALVITEWSRKSEMVSKLIDLKFHVDQQRILYDAAVDSIVNVKRDLTYARMPSPDLKTALQVLSTGTAPWMPDLHYIEAPPLTIDEQAKWVNDINTLLSLRLNLEEFDKIPFHFKDYEIGSGRVTFKVPGEFEVDLTIADEDLEKQFWFIDFRLSFSPAPSTLPDSLRLFLEARVNDVLGKDGLLGCYKFLHEFVLTHKLNELKRQALHLRKTSWTGTLMVEPLNRALAVQYWTSRTQQKAPKSWILIAVSSNRPKNGRTDPKSTSSLTVKWYRDNKEVTDAYIPLDVENLSAETLLKTVVGRHIDHILTTIHDRLQLAPRFKNRESGMVLRVSQSNSVASSLNMQVRYKDTASLLMEPTTGLFAVTPHSKFTISYEHQLNDGQNPAEDGVTCLENVRCALMEDELNRRGSVMGWNTRKCPLNNEDLRSVVRNRQWTRIIWLQRSGWGPGWFIMVLLGLSGDEWWLLEADPNAQNHALKFQARLPLNKGYPDLSSSFWNNLTLFASGMITQSVDLRELHDHQIKSRPREGRTWTLPQQVRLPAIDIALSGIFPSMVFDNAEKDASKSNSAASAEPNGTHEEQASIVRPHTGNDTAKQPWAKDMVVVKFQAVQSTPTETLHLVCISDAFITVRKPSSFATLTGMVGHDVSYNPEKGQFSVRIRHGIGEPVLNALKSKIKAIDRFVNFLDSLEKAKGIIQSESVTLTKVTFSYCEPRPHASTAKQPPPPRWRVVLDLSKETIDIELEQGNPHLRIADLMRRLVNSEGGIQALMLWLPAARSSSP
ncbi:hypothetical protein G7046_g8741 [Stylonectria norvegica]|nr:hypothetical protein G7046_g8741 [Stylonectria norvegica]